MALFFLIYRFNKFADWPHFFTIGLIILWSKCTPNMKSLKVLRHFSIYRKFNCKNVCLKSNNNFEQDKSFHLFWDISTVESICQQMWVVWGPPLSCRGVQRGQTWGRVEGLMDWGYSSTVHSWQMKTERGIDGKFPWTTVWLCQVIYISISVMSFFMDALLLLLALFINTITLMVKYFTVIEWISSPLHWDEWIDWIKPQFYLLMNLSQWKHSWAKLMTWSTANLQCNYPPGQVMMLDCVISLTFWSKPQVTTDL